MKKFYGIDGPVIKAIAFIRNAMISGAFGYFIAERNLIAGWVTGASILVLIYAFNWAHTEKDDEK